MLGSALAAALAEVAGIALADAVPLGVAVADEDGAALADADRMGRARTFVAADTDTVAVGIALGGSGGTTTLESRRWIHTPITMTTMAVPTLRRTAATLEMGSLGAGSTGSGGRDGSPSPPDHGDPPGSCATAVLAPPATGAVRGAGVGVGSRASSARAESRDGRLCSLSSEKSSATAGPWSDGRTSAVAGSTGRASG